MLISCASEQELLLPFDLLGKTHDESCANPAAAMGKGIKQHNINRNHKNRSVIRSANGVFRISLTKSSSP